MYEFKHKDKRRAGTQLLGHDMCSITGIKATLVTSQLLLATHVYQFASLCPGGISSQTSFKSTRQEPTRLTSLCRTRSLRPSCRPTTLGPKQSRTWQVRRLKVLPPRQAADRPGPALPAAVHPGPVPGASMRGSSTAKKKC